jgi:hypothetical protein
MMAAPLFHLPPHRGESGKFCASSSANLLAFVCGPLATGATYELYSEADYSFNAKGLDSQAAEPRFPRPNLRQRHQDRGESWPR